MDLPALVAELERSLETARLVATAERLVAAPSPTCDAGAALDALAEILDEDGFTVERHEAEHPRAPAVVARLDSGRPGRTLQFDVHLDTVHLPFVGPEIEGGRLTGRGACDMKGGAAAAVEALRLIRDSGQLDSGRVLLTAHDLHEAPWGRGEQLDALIRAGIVGDAVLIPEPFTDHLPIAGRGQACWKITLSRPGPPVHEVYRPADEPSVLAAGAELVTRLARMDDQIASERDPVAGRASVFVGQFHGGEIYNQFPQSCWLEGTRRWLPGTARAVVEEDFRARIASFGRDTGVTVDLHYQLVRDAFRLDPTGPFAVLFQDCHQVVSGRRLPTGPKPFVDDGNSFCSLGGVPAITHGPRSGGAHTLHEWVDIADMRRVSLLYALIAAWFAEQ